MGSEMEKAGGAAMGAPGNDIVFEMDRNDAGINAVCEALDSLGLTLFERWRVCWCVEQAAFGMMNENVQELAEKMKRGPSAPRS